MPYLSFNGNCEEALSLYQKAFGGTIQHMVRYGDAPNDPEHPMDEHQKSKVMHAQMSLTETGGISVADAMCPIEQGNNISIHVHLSSESLARTAYHIIAEEGEVVSPIAPNPPPDDAGVSGAVRDPFGFCWVLSAMRD